MSIYKIWKPTVCNRPLEFTEALNHAFKNIFNFKGRARRSEFWWTSVGMYLITLVVYIIAAIIGAATTGVSAFTDSSSSPFGGAVAAYVVIGIWCLVEFILMIGLAIRRLHDTGHSGWWIGLSYLLIFICYGFIIGGCVGEKSIGLIVIGAIFGIAAFIIGLYVFFLTIFDSDIEENKYGISQKYTVEEAVADTQTAVEKEPEAPVNETSAEEEEAKPAIEKIVEEAEKTLEDSTE